MTARWEDVWRIGYGFTLLVLGVLVAYTAMQTNRALDETFESRRSGAYLACIDREELKADIRWFLVKNRGLDPSRLPRRGDHVIFEPLAPAASPKQACRWYAVRVVPEASRP